MDIATGSPAPIDTTGDILSGYANVQATATTALVTIPAGRTWKGTVGVSCATSVVAGGSAAVASSVINIDQDTGTSTPADGPIVRVDVTIPAVAANITPASQSASVSGQPLTVAADPNNPCVLEHIGTITNGTAPQASGWAIGELL